MNKTTAV